MLTNATVENNAQGFTVVAKMDDGSLLRSSRAYKTRGPATRLCNKCQTPGYEFSKAVWYVLQEAQEIAPSPAYVSRFSVFAKATKSGHTLILCRRDDAKTKTIIGHHNRQDLPRQVALSMAEKVNAHLQANQRLNSDHWVV